MSDSSEINHHSSPMPQKQKEIVIGLVATEKNEAAVVKSLLQIKRDGYTPLVGYDAIPKPEAAKFADAIGASTIYLSRERTNGEAPVELLAAQARDAGYGGMIFHQNPDAEIDLDESAATLDHTSEYWATAETKAVPTETEVIAGIPTYNEEIGIGSVILETLQYCDRVIVVDDGSNDSTVKLAKQAGAEVLQHKMNRGKGAALKTLFDYVSELEYQALILLDGDGQHTPRDLPNVVEPIMEGHAELVIGSRYLDKGQDDETPVYRRVGQRVLDFLTMGSSRVKVTDSQSGYRALSPNAVENISITTEAFGVESEMIDSAAQAGLRIEERPIDVRYEGIDGQTQNPLRHGLSVATFILQLVRDRHPLLFFSVPGFFLLLAGGAYGMEGIFLYRNSGAFYPAKVFISGFLTILGTLGVFIGLVLNRIQVMIAQAEAQ